MFDRDLKSPSKHHKFASRLTSPESAASMRSPSHTDMFDRSRIPEGIAEGIAEGISESLDAVALAGDALAETESASATAHTASVNASAASATAAVSAETLPVPDSAVRLQLSSPVAARPSGAVAAAAALTPAAAGSFVYPHARVLSGSERWALDVKPFETLFVDRFATHASETDTASAIATDSAVADNTVADGNADVDSNRASDAAARSPLRVCINVYALKGSSIAPSKSPLKSPLKSAPDAVAVAAAGGEGENDAGVAMAVSADADGADKVTIWQSVLLRTLEFPVTKADAASEGTAISH